MSENEDDEEIPSDSEPEEIKSQAEKQPLDKFKQHLAREKKEEEEYYEEIKKNRVEQLQQQNQAEDEIISKYEKLLKLNKRKRSNGSTVTSKFNDGLDYLLELCTEESIQKMYSAAKEVDQEQSDDDFDDLVVDSKMQKKCLDKRTNYTLENISTPSARETKRVKKLEEVEKKYFGDDNDFFDNFDNDSCEGSDSELDSEEEASASDGDVTKAVPMKANAKRFKMHPVPKNTSNSSDVEDSELENDRENDGEESEEDDTASEGEIGDEDEEANDDSEDKIENEKPDEWEDIYGRKRDRAGNLIKEDTAKYVSPHMRKVSQASETDNDPKRREILQTLKRQIKGQVNRLAESNLHRITIDIENLFGTNARHDVNSTLTEVILNSLISNVLASERLVLEQTLLIATLHANIGSEIGAFFLQVIVEKFDAMFKDIDSINVGNKSVDNAILIICHLFTYRLFKHNLIYELLDKLCERLSEKRIECTLLILRSIGFLLRKDDPLMLKGFIIKVQKLANVAGEDSAKNSRIMFMLDILMAIKNNNMSKIPQFDPTLVEHFRKLLKQFVRAGKYVTTLAITMEDLLKADERGKWWLVGSAWAGDEKSQEDDNRKNGTDSIGEAERKKIFELSRKQRMNTDDKKNVFYILMTAEDYLDAFEKIVTTVKDERSVISVIVHCCLSEKEYNPYYSIVAQKFCDHNRKFQLALQFTLWDKIKDINSLSIKKVSNLARLSIFLIENDNLPLSVLKIIEFSQIEKVTLYFLRQVMLGLLLLEEEKFRQVFERITSHKLKNFKAQLQLFLKVFLLKDEKKINISEEQWKKLKHRIHLADKILMIKQY